MQPVVSHTTATAGAPDFQALEFAYVRHADQDAAPPARHPVVVVGAGPVGLSLAIDLAQHGVRVVLLDNDHRLSTGSRAICFAKRTLEIFDRLGCGQPMVDKGVSWNVGRLFFGEQQIYSFDLLSDADHDRPAFINLQQYYVEGYLAARAAELPAVDLRWKNEITQVEPAEGHVRLTIGTPDGPYALLADHVVACDGSRSAVRRQLGLESKGRAFKDRFLIADVKMDAPFPSERWFWFDPPFHPNQSVLLHRQPDNLWRIDFQLGWDADPDEEKKPERIVPRVKALLGADATFTLEWASVYTFSCQRMERFRHGRVLFAGDAAHGVSPFGARGANSGVQDADNLAWKLAAVLRGEAGDALLDSYASEREFAADENILHSTRATDFITPKSEVSRLFRDAVLDLAREFPFARALVNSGRLSVPATLVDSPLNTPDADAFNSPMTPGAAAVDAPLGDGLDNGRDAGLDNGRDDGLGNGLDNGPGNGRGGGRGEWRSDGRGNERPPRGWLPRCLPGPGFAALVFGGDDALLRTLREAAEGLAALNIVRLDVDGLAARRYDARPGTVYLLRPDQHVCARWRRIDRAAVRGALRRALALNEEIA